MASNAAVTGHEAQQATQGDALRSSIAPMRPARLAAQVEVHDAQQIEIRFAYALDSVEMPQRYTAELYLFVPRNVGVNRTNYTREQFYADVTPLMRLDAARLPLEALADPRNPASPLWSICRAIEDFRSSRRPPKSSAVAVHVKLYAYLFATAAKYELQRTSRRFRALDSAERALEVERKALTLFRRLESALWSFRQMRAAFWPFEQVAHASLAEALQAADEYMSLVLDERLAGFVSRVAKTPLHHGFARALWVRCRLRALGLAQREARYRQRYGYVSLSSQGNQSEYFGYRSSLVKKTVQQALYLEPREIKGERFQRNAVGAVGAALAAIWAWATQLPAALASVSGGTKLWLFGAAVVAYVLKDRIKALTNDFLTQRLRTGDHVSWLEGSSLGVIGLGSLRGRLKETMSFLAAKEVPAEIRELRLRKRTVRQAELAAEEVIFYQKVVDFDTRDTRQPLPAGYAVRDILRLNIRHFLVRLDEPVDEVRHFDPVRESFGVAEVPKVYHLNGVLKLTREDGDGKCQQRLERIRVVLEKRGIVRVETIETRGPFLLPKAAR